MINLLFSKHILICSSRYEKYLQMVCAGKVEPEKLPPTSDAARQHGFRVHLQIIGWKMLVNSLKYEEWGWKKDGEHFSPVTISKPVAPDNILKIIKCKCKSSGKNQCGTNLCTCKKNGLPCMSACGECHGETCYNRKTNEYDDEDVINEEDEFAENIFDILDAI